jgi:hypothetical protein
VLRLIKLWLQVPVEERDGDGKRIKSFCGAKPPQKFGWTGATSDHRATPVGGAAIDSMLED